MTQKTEKVQLLIKKKQLCFGVIHLTVLIFYIYCLISIVTGHY